MAITKARGASKIIFFVNVEMASLASVTPLAFYILFTITLAGVLITLGLVILTALT
jgi:hypothetical protein